MHLRRYPERDPEIINAKGGAGTVRLSPQECDELIAVLDCELDNNIVEED